MYTIDDLGQIIEKNYKIREKSIKQAEEIIKFKIIEYKNWLSENNILLHQVNSAHYHNLHMMAIVYNLKIIFRLSLKR